MYNISMKYEVRKNQKYGDAVDIFDEKNIPKERVYVEKLQERINGIDIAITKLQETKIILENKLSIVQEKINEAKTNTK